jgi:hypothetical protein
MTSVCCVCRHEIAGYATASWGGEDAHHHCAERAFQALRRTPAALTSQQLAAVEAAEGAIADEAHFALQGVAGTGKTTVLAEIAARHPGTHLCAPTAKAASVLTAKTGVLATTVHKIFYRLTETIKREDDARRLVFKPTRAPGSLRGHTLLIDECFVAYTPVDTPTGPRRICDLRPGDKILNATGVDEVVAVRKKESSGVIKVEFGGKTVACSGDHPFFTERGVVRAGELRSGDRLARQTATLRLLRQALCAEKRICPILQRALRACVVAAASGVQGPSLHGRTRPEVRCWSPPLAVFGPPESDSGISKDYCAQSGSQTGSQSQAQRPFKRIRAQACDPRWQWPWHDDTAEAVKGHFGRGVDSGIYRFYGKETPWISHALQDRPGQSAAYGSNRSERGVTPESQSADKGQEESRVPDFLRVDSLELLESGDPRLDQFRDARGKLYLYDIQARRHQSFSVNGALVHNCSMLGKKMAADVLRTGVKLVAVGDPGQLPPVEGLAFFTEAVFRRSFTLTEIHRQALENPIIRQAHRVRQGLGYEADGEAVRVIDRVSSEELIAADVVLVGRRRTRMRMNAERRRILGFNNPLPRLFEPLICLRNLSKYGLCNGAIYHASRDLQEDDKTIGISTDDGDVEVPGVFLPPGHEYDRPDLPVWMTVFAFGYALTVHQAQGSEWDKVLLIDESAALGDDRTRWLYTGVTRASREIVIARSLPPTGSGAAS